MAIALMEDEHEVPYLEVNADDVPCKFNCKINGKTFTFTFKWNEQGGFYTCDLETLQGEVLARGDVIRYGRVLFGSIADDRFPNAMIMPKSFRDEVSAVTKDNFGKTVRLYVYEV
jgi:hypothetical protein